MYETIYLNLSINQCLYQELKIYWGRCFLVRMRISTRSLYICNEPLMFRQSNGTVVLFLKRGHIYKESS